MFYFNLLLNNWKIIGVTALIAVISYLFVSKKMVRNNNKLLKVLIEKKDILIKEREIVIEQQNENFEKNKEIIKLEEKEEQDSTKRRKELIKKIEELEENEEFEVKL